MSFDRPYYLGIKIGSDAEMSPRSALSSSAYAFRAKTTEQLSIPFYIAGFGPKYLGAQSIQVSPGVADIAGLLLKASSSCQITITNDTYWVGTKNTVNAWIYVYVYNDDNTVGYKISNTAPNLADEYSNTEGTKRYILNASTYYRCIGAVRTDASGNILKFYCDDSQYLYDIPQSATTTKSNGTWTTLTDLRITNGNLSRRRRFSIINVFLSSISNFVPVTSRKALFGIGGHNSPGFGNPVGVWIRPYGAVWSTDYASGLRKMTCNYQNGLGGNEGIYAQMEMFTDDSQRIEYRTDGFNTFEIKVLAYWMDI